MGAGVTWRFDELPERYKKQVQEYGRKRTNRTTTQPKDDFEAVRMSVAARACVVQGKGGKAVERAFDASGAKAVEPKNMRQAQMTSAERKFNREVLGGKGLFEAVTLRCPSGNRYTPDWLVMDGGVPVLIEVKGSYRLGSEGRARTAFMEAASLFSGIFRFVWAAQVKGGGWDVREVIYGGD